MIITAIFKITNNIIMFLILELSKKVCFKLFKTLARSNVNFIIHFISHCSIQPLNQNKSVFFMKSNIMN